jgi:hypothetical protein
MKNISKTISSICALVILPVLNLSAQVVFSEDFSNGAAASARLTTHGTAAFTFNNGDLNIGTGPSYNYFRTNTANSFVDNGISAIRYTANFGFSNAGANVGGLAFRLDTTGAASSDATSYSFNSVIDTGYTLRQYNDGGAYGLIFSRFNSGARTDLINDFTNYTSILNSVGPNDFSILVTNTLTSVDFSISYGGTLLTTISDTSLSRLTTGEGIAGIYGNNGTPTTINAQFYGLTAQVIPEPTTYVMLLAGLLTLFVLARLRKSTAV